MSVCRGITRVRYPLKYPLGDTCLKLSPTPGVAGNNKKELPPQFASVHSSPDERACPC
jgi:hypothetical protein